MELYRALTYANIALLQSAVTTASSDATYTADAAYSGTQIADGELSRLTDARAVQPAPDGDRPRRTLLPRRHVHRGHTPLNGRAVKRVTVVIHRPTETKSLARLTSIFDESTG